MRTVLIVITLLASAGLFAQVYKSVAPDGSIQYSDRPESPDAEVIEVQPVQAFEAPAIAAPAPVKVPGGAGAAEADAPGYEAFEVTNPQPDQTIIDNNGSVPVALSVKPGLRTGHVVEVLFDGKPSGSGKSLSLTLTNVDRGTHRVGAVIKDASGKEIVRAGEVTFHLRRAIARPRPGPA